MLQDLIRPGSMPATAWTTPCGGQSKQKHEHELKKFQMNFGFAIFDAAVCLHATFRCCRSRSGPAARLRWPEPHPVDTKASMCFH
ncbi:hypothetical protein DUNSADRAFT_11171 [Dunaliella salina]|uniref:Encoded protein n=1 Tax=Dunaliella salina TaxID=3046 RepID=A0ABQ7GDZ7_DUNSA|nr:hypothetical protein DUNSADRAFT_11171 [Dunaliella salina]|eukprot:KAF5832832.1 hypothetical protein DUNSADRAFT_11171 [Dunaliella salina]